MSKRMMINLLATMVVTLGGVSMGFASPKSLAAHPMTSCQGGGGSCVCDAGQRCIATPKGCGCGK